MKLKNAVAGIAALAMMAAPVVASAAEAPAPKPATEQVNGDNAFFGAKGGVIAFVALLAIIAGIVAATHGHKRPNSP